MKKCENCDNQTTSKRARFCSRECYLVKEGRKKMSERFSGKNNPAYGKIYRTKESNPEWAEKISKTCKDRKINVGDKNGMKKDDARTRASETRKKKFKEDKDFSKRHAEMTAKSWADGKHANTKVGRCKWYDYTKKDGTIIKCQGTWELAFAKWADQSGIEFTAHRGRIQYTDDAGQSRSYYPDFYVFAWECYVDTKSKYFLDLNKDKIRCIFASNPNIKLRILGKEELVDLGVDLKYKPETVDAKEE